VPDFQTWTACEFISGPPICESRLIVAARLHASLHHTRRQRSAHKNLLLTQIAETIPASFCSFLCDRTKQRARGIVRTRDKLHERAKAPGGGCSKDVKPVHGCFQPGAQPRKAVRAADRFFQSIGQEFVLGNVHSVAGSEQDMVSCTFGSIIETDLHPPAHNSCF